jgi:hypothetical protein
MESFLDRVGTLLYKGITPEQWERIRTRGTIRFIWRDALLTGLVGGLFLSALPASGGPSLDFFLTRQFLHAYLKAGLGFFVVFLALYALQWRTYERRRARLQGSVAGGSA